MAPHVVAYCIGWATSSTTKASTTVKAGWGYTLGRQHDIGMGIYHFAVNALLPLVWAGAANKAEFGCSTIKIDVSGDALRMAVAVIPVAGLNLQLDCNEPCAFPSSLCVASFNTVYGGFSLMDFLAGIAAGLCDVAISWAVGKIAGKIVGAAGGAIASMLGKSATGITVMLGIGIVASKFPGTAYALQAGAELVVGWVIGTPLGYSFPSPLGWGSTYGGKLNDTVNDLISPSPPKPGSPSTPSSPTSSSATPSSTGASSSGGSPPSSTTPPSSPPAPPGAAPAAQPPSTPPPTAPPGSPAPGAPPTGGPPPDPIV
jgi:hypothetical protein